MPANADRLAAIRAAETHLVTANRDFAADMAENTARLVQTDAGTTVFVRAEGKLREYPVTVWDLRNGGPVPS